MKEEWDFSEEVGNFVLEHNRRRKRTEIGDSWIRVRPLSRKEIEGSWKNPAVIKFLAPGTVSHITEILAARPKGGFLSIHEGLYGLLGLIEIECAGDKLLVESDEFYRSWIRCTPEQSWIETDQIRRRSA